MIRIPGKVFLCGEYSVLEGAPAIVAAVARHGWAWLEPGATVASPFVVEAERRAAGWLTAHNLKLPEGRPVVETKAFRLEDGAKIGLGSSAAATVGALAALLDAAGADLADPAVRTDLVGLGIEAHRAAQGGAGSGADVAACVHGGVLAYMRTGREGEAASVHALLPPKGVVAVWAWSGTPASTQSLVMRIGREAVVNSGMIELASEFAECFSQGDGPGVIAAGRRYGIAMQVLGERTGVPLVVPACASYMAIAERHGGAAKPSGAGGGDLSVAFLPSATAAEQVQLEAKAAGLFPCSLPLDPDGVCRDHGEHATSARAFSFQEGCDLV